ncbi:hypothetical protein E2C01_100295 [Portunus trituberculatus]|uniref:Uncharacterized protein n=1 Tax=Portunus trituberculatus TaxID=210409 RepID=A0A5B7KHL3_PORTR|nr:hypothetical protein [Portunus trituberculatus]
MKRNRPNSCGGAAGSVRSSFKPNIPPHNRRDRSQGGDNKTAAVPAVVAAAKVGRSRFFMVQEGLKSDRMARECKRTLAEDLALSLHYMKHGTVVLRKTLLVIKTRDRSDRNKEKKDK